VGIEPDDWQTEVLASEHPRKILCCGRQTGKSTVAAVLAIHKALAQPGATVLVVAPGERQAKLLFSKAASLYRQAGLPLSAHSERRTGLELSNGSVIEALPAVERTTRGYSVDLLIVDEAAAVPDLDYMGILPALIATQGEQVLLSTPRGRGAFSTSSTTRMTTGQVMVRSERRPHPRRGPRGLQAHDAGAVLQARVLLRVAGHRGRLFSYEDVDSGARGPARTCRPSR
jgi:hypothetical protein